MYILGGRELDRQTERDLPLCQPPLLVSVSPKLISVHSVCMLMMLLLHVGLSYCSQYQKLKRLRTRDAASRNGRRERRGSFVC